jgi:hypothetical protein
MFDPRYYIGRAKADLSDMFLREWQVLKGRFFLPGGGHRAGGSFQQEGTHASFCELLDNG